MGGIMWFRKNADNLLLQSEQHTPHCSLLCNQTHLFDSYRHKKIDSTPRHRLINRDLLVVANKKTPESLHFFGVLQTSEPS